MSKADQAISVIPEERIINKIFLLRGRKVLLDRDLAELYGVSTGNLNKAVKRNAKRFPEDFMFQLSKGEYDAIRFQFGTLKRGRHPKYLPHVFTEHGVAMLSSVLNSERAVKINIQIIRAFIRLRELLATNQELARKIKDMEKKYDALFLSVFARLDSFTAIELPAKRKIGFAPPRNGKRKQ